MNSTSEISVDKHSICSAYRKWHTDNKCDPFDHENKSLAKPTSEPIQCQVFSYKGEEVRGDDLQKINHLCNNLKQGTANVNNSNPEPSKDSPFWTFLKKGWPVFVVIGTAWTIAYIMRFARKMHEESRAAKEKGEDKKSNEIFQIVKQKEITNILDHILIWRWNVFNKSSHEEGTSTNTEFTELPVSTRENETEDQLNALAHGQERIRNTLSPHLKYIIEARGIKENEEVQRYLAQYTLSGWHKMDTREVQKIAPIFNQLIQIKPEFLEDDFATINTQAIKLHMVWAKLFFPVKISFFEEGEDDAHSRLLDAQRRGFLPEAFFKLINPSVGQSWVNLMPHIKKAFIKADREKTSLSSDATVSIPNLFADVWYEINNKDNVYYADDSDGNEPNGNSSSGMGGSFPPLDGSPPSSPQAKPFSSKQFMQPTNIPLTSGTIVFSKVPPGSTLPISTMAFRKPLFYRAPVTLRGGII